MCLATSFGLAAWVSGHLDFKWLRQVTWIPTHMWPEWALTEY